MEKQNFSSYGYDDGGSGDVNMLQPRGPAGVGCDAGNRLPTNKFPLYSVTKTKTIVEGQTSADVEFRADRDVLFTNMSIEVRNQAGRRIRAKFSVEYCNVKLSVNTDTGEYRPCCIRKPFWLVGVRENKTLTMTVTPYTAPTEGDEYTVEVTYSGVQGNGCCG